uniref:Uncharacterized protein TCIL3000_11_2990 n=1 Tax=Trypanosoma congolense (strain IL3000) TaxID=1068625 RepID=G0UZT6_TRYCI|nr:unnamed protein product [Trypanosoma congolense IL3000]
MIVSELTSAFQCGNASRQSYLIPCVATSLQILLNLTRPPTDKSDEGSVSTFNRICGTIRTSDGVRTLLEVLKIRGDSAMSVRLQLFPVIARALQLMVTLRRYADTRLLFDALGVNTVARDLMTHYGDVQKEYLSMMGPRYVASEVYATGRFMENIKCFLFDESSPSAPAFSVDPVELEQRQAIIARSHITYSRESLLELIYRHLEAEGLVNAAAALRHDAFLPSDVSAPQQSANVSQDLTVSSIGAPTLDSIIHSYLIQQHEKSANPITTLPQFDLRKNHVYYPLDVSVDQTRNAFDRRLTQKMGLDFSLRARTNENHLVYRYPGYLFDIAGDIDEPGGESVAFCDDGETLVVGNSDGKISLFENFPDESMGGKFLEQHVAFENDAVIGIFASGDSTLLGLVSDAHKITVMGRDELPIVRFQIEGSRAATFSCCNAYLLATCDEEHTCRLYDLGAQSVVRHFSDPSWVGENIENVATFDVFSQLVLSDAVLWDVRCGDKPIYRFDRFTDSFCNIFHPFNPLVIIDEKIWDLRTLSILRTVHAFRNSRNLQTIPLGRVIYSFRDSSSLTSFNAPVLSVVESYTFETVFSTEVRPAFRSFSIDPTDRYCAAILDDDSSTVVRVFSTSSGPLPGQQGFPLPQDSRGGGGDSGLSEDGEEDEVGSDSTWSGVYEDVDDDESEDDSNYMGHDLVAESSDDVGFSHTDEETESGTSVPTEEDSVEVREDRETLDETGSSADASVDST